MLQPLPLDIDPICTHCKHHSLVSLFKPQRGFWDICCQHCGTESMIPATWPESKMKDPGETTPVDTKDPLYVLTENIREKITSEIFQLYAPRMGNHEVEALHEAKIRQTLNSLNKTINKMDFTEFIAEARDTVKPVHVPTAELGTDVLITTLGSTLQRCLVIGVTKPPVCKMFVCIQNCSTIFDAVAMVQFAEAKLGIEIDKQMTEE